MGHLPVWIITQLKKCHGLPDFPQQMKNVTVGFIPVLCFTITTEKTEIRCFCAMREGAL